MGSARGIATKLAECGVGRRGARAVLIQANVTKPANISLIFAEARGNRPVGDVRCQRTARGGAFLPTSARSHSGAAAQLDGQPSFCKDGWVPMRRLTTPADVGDAVALLCSEQVGFITGQILAVDGGASLASADFPLNFQQG